MVACGCENVRPCHKSGFHDAGGIDVDCKRPTRLWNSAWVEYRKVMGCLVCMDDTSVFYLQHGRKLWDHKWTNKSIFWDLPYWSTFIIRHKLDVMHIEKNVIDNIFNKVTDIKGKTKDNMNARRDLKIICNRIELELDEHRSNVMPKAVYTLGKEQKRRVGEWIRGQKFPDGYASNLARGVLEAIERSPGKREQQRGTGTLVSSLRYALRAAAVDVDSGRSKKELSIRSRLQSPPHDYWTISAQQLHCSYTLAATVVE
ncbi:UNVERIFIED_CONTAM: hypothetical protein Sradi_5833900 [Sesamum radiatum]|uniref:Uncharacterized protein n=1 Tax=Sesamum radiatum TaxID=300843 RepID=A0AAW2KRV9_SESRA